MFKICVNSQNDGFVPAISIVNIALGIIGRRFTVLNKSSLKHTVHAVQKIGTQCVCMCLMTIALKLDSPLGVQNSFSTFKFTVNSTKHVLVASVLVQH